MASSRAGICSYHLLLTLLFLWLRCATCQQKQPFAGQGSSSPSSPVDVYVSASLDRLLAVDDREYTFDCIIFVILTWTDPRAVHALVKRKEETASGSPCLHYCDSEDQQPLCCDTMWMPAIAFTNAKFFSEERIIYEQVQLGGGPGTDGNQTAVMWIQRILGTYSTAMEFRRFPFDSQKLKIEMESRDKNVVLHGSSTGLETGIFRMAGKGDAVSGWQLKSLRLVVANNSKTLVRVNNSVSLTRSDPLPYRSGNDGSQAGLTPATASIVLDVDRVVSFYIVNMVVPISFTVALSWSVFAINPKQLNTRITVTVMLILALVSLSFIIRQQLPSSSYITCIHWILIFSYIEIAAADVETLYVHYFLRKDSIERTQKWRRQKTNSGFKPQTVYGTLTSGGLVLSFNPAGANLDDVGSPSGRRLSEQALRTLGRSSLDVDSIVEEEAIPLLGTPRSLEDEFQGRQLDDSSRLERSNLGLTEPRPQETPSSPSVLGQGEFSGQSGAGARVQGSALRSASSSSRSGRLRVGFIEDKIRVPLDRESSGSQEMVRKLLGELDEDLPSKQVALAAAMAGRQFREYGRRPGSVSNAHFANLKALRRKLPKKTMLRRLNSARQKIQEQVTEEEVTEGAVVIDRACLIIFPIVYFCAVLIILQNYLSTASE